MEWLKDKKNLPVVAALLVVLLVVSAGLIALELGAFSGSPAVTPSPPSITGSGSVGGPPGGMPPGGGLIQLPAAPRGPGGPAGVPLGRPAGIPRGVAGTPAPAAAVVKKPDTVNPMLGPDPFKIPGGPQKAAKIASRLLPPKPTLRDTIGPLNLFVIRPPAPPPVPAIPDAPAFSQQNGGDAASRYRLSGIINGPDGINAIMEVDGQSQSVKPGDSLSDGTRVTNIQATSVTLRTTGGATFSQQLSAGTPDQGQTNFNGQGSFQPGFPQQGQP